MLGRHLIRSWCKDQSVIALSSGEAELYAANYGAAQVMGLRSMAVDLGIEFSLDLLIDASAAMGIINRQGLGKVRHIATQDLWLQKAVRDQEIKMFKVDSLRNIADLMTKPVMQHEIVNHMGNMSLKWWDVTLQKAR